MISIGTIGLIKGITTFDQSKGARLATYAARCVENEILTPMRRRTSRGLMQKEIADKVGMTHGAYKSLEEGFTQHIEPEKVDRLAQFYGVPVTDFLDEFNHFLYDAQAVRIRAYRETFGMGKKPFARKMGIPIRCLQEWESGRKVISIKCWERHFKGRA